MQNVTIEPFKIVGIGVKTTNENNQAAQEIAQLWQRFMYENLSDKIPNKVDDTIYSLYTDYEGDYTQPYLAVLGCKVTYLNEIPEGMLGKSAAGGSYVKTSARGNLMKDLVVNQWSEIFSVNLDRAYTTDFEAFGEKARNPVNAEVDFYVAVK